MPVLTKRGCITDEIFQQLLLQANSYCMPCCVRGTFFIIVTGMQFALQVCWAVDVQFVFVVTSPTVELCRWQCRVLVNLYD